MLRRLSCVLLLTLLQPTPALALDPTKRISQYIHNAWSTRDTISSIPFTIVQTPDGYIWINTSEGVLQFDGVRFARWTPGGGQRLSASKLKTTRDGSIWFTGVGILSRWKNGSLTNYVSAAPSDRYSVAEDRDGRIWATRYFARDGSALCEVLETSLRCDARANGVAPLGARVLLADRDGSFWLGGDTGLLHWSQGIQTPYRPAGLAAT